MSQINEPSALQISLLKELFEAHLGPIREDVKAIRGDMRIDQSAIRTDLALVSKRAEEAHEQIAKFKNRVWGIGTALGVGGGGLGAFLAKNWPNLFN